MRKKFADAPKLWRRSGLIFREGLKTSAKKVLFALSLIMLITSICSTTLAKSVYEVDTSGGGAPKDVPRPSSTGVGHVMASAVCSGNIVTFRTDSSPELDWYQPCNGGDNMIDFYINVNDVDISCIRSAELTLAVWDIDYECGSVCGGCCERDSVYFNGRRLTIPEEYLTGTGGQWSYPSFEVDPAWIIDGDNYVQIFVDTQCQSCWCLECDWGELALEVGITLTKVDDVNNGDCVWPGREITYMIRYNYLEEPNVGDVNDVNLIDYLPDEVEYVSSDPCGFYDCSSHTITWRIGTLEPNEPGSVMLKVKVKCPEPGSIIRNKCELKNGDVVLDSDYEYTSVCVNYLIVDDFERYTDSNSIREVWKGSPISSHLTISSDPCVPYQKHTGAKAMAYFYDNNSVTYYCKAYADINGPNSLNFSTNWLAEGVKALSLWFYGIPDIRGSFSYTGTDPLGPYAVTIKSSGADIWGTADQFHYTYRQLTDIGYIQCRIDNMDNTDASAKAGLMIRNTLYPNSKNAAIVITPRGEVAFQYRAETGDISIGSSVMTDTAPHWLRLTRWWDGAYHWIMAEHANDVSGSPGTWMRIGNELLAPLPGWEYQVYIGLCVTSHNYGVMCDANFSNVTMALLEGSEGSITPDWQSQDIGIFYTDNDPEPMYVVLKDSDSYGIWYYPDSRNPANADPNVTRINTWTHWLIDLNDFCKQGVDLTDIQRMYIGFVNRDSGSGLVYIDDIRLYSSRCLLEDKPVADFSGDCAVDYLDLKMMADEWLSMCCPRTDLYKDYIVDFRDFAIFADNWLEGKPWP